MKPITDTKKLMAMPEHKTLDSFLVVITPAIAAEWMKRNHSNRLVKNGNLGGLVRDMLGGRHLVNGDTIRFDLNGRLIDGQHRLLAIIQSGLPITMFVVTGLEPAAQETIDRNARRTVADYLSMNGVKRANTVGAAARLAMAARAGLLSNKKAHFTDAEVIEFLDQNPIMEVAGDVGAKLSNSISAPPSVLAVAWAEISQIDPDAATEFFNSLASSRTNGDGDPRAALLRRLQHAARQREKIAPLTQLAMIVRAWNVHRRDETIHVLKVRAASPVPAVAA